MCIIAEKAHLSNTEIFTCVTGLADGKATRQLVVYQNKVSANDPKVKDNFMCLPIPLKDGVDTKEIALYDFSHENKGHFSEEYKNFFTNCKEAFPKKLVMTDTLSAPRSSSRSAPRQFLEVVQVGAYKCSLARTTDDVLRLDPAVFGKSGGFMDAVFGHKIDVSGLREVLQKNYAHDFAFLICAFKQPHDKPLSPHPIAYSLPLSPSSSLFIPTKHYHGGDKPNAATVGDWDHDIFVFGGDNEYFTKQNAKWNGPEPERCAGTSDTLSDVLIDLFKQHPGRDSAILGQFFRSGAHVNVKGHFNNIDFQPAVSVKA